MVPSTLSTFSRPETLRFPASRVAAGPLLTLPLLAMVLPIAVGLGGEGHCAVLSLVIGLSSPSLAATSYFGSAMGRLLAPIAFGVLFLVSILVLPFNSLGFFVDAATTILLALATIPRERLAWADSF